MSIQLQGNNTTPHNKETIYSNPKSRLSYS